MANERPLLVIREFAPGNGDETRSVRNVEETIVLGVGVSILKEANHDQEHEVHT